MSVLTISDSKCNKPVCPQNFKHSTLICNFLCYLLLKKELSKVINVQIHKNDNKYPPQLRLCYSPHLN